MKHLMVLIFVLALMTPSLAGAEKKVNEYGEDITPASSDVIEQVPPAAAAQNAKKSVVQTQTVKKSKIEKSTTPAPEITQNTYFSSGPNTSGRYHRFRAGIVGPGYGYVNRGVNSVMTIGAEGEYFFYERLAANFRIETATKFKSPTIIMFTPRARYVFDLDKHPRLAVYAQAGVGLALSVGGGTYASADIALPGGGFWWQWNDRWSVGADTSLHIFVRSTTAVGFNIAPAVRYLF